MKKVVKITTKTLDKQNQMWYSAIQMADEEADEQTDELMPRGCKHKKIKNLK